MTSIETPRVSVVIPAFNMERHIGATLDSLQSQTFRSFEALVVDDCSTDNTALIVRARAAVDPRVRYIRLESNSNRPAVPRNRGIAEARGEFVAFLDHDDLWSKRKLERQVSVLDSRPDLALVHSCLWEFTPRSWLRGLVYLPNPYRRRADYETLRQHNVVQCSSAVARVEILRDLGGFDERLELRTVEDYHLWLRVARNHKIAYISEIHGAYRWSRAGASGQEDWLGRHAYLDEQESALVLKSRPSLIRQVSRKTAGFPLALYFHLLEANIRRALRKPPRVWER